MRDTSLPPADFSSITYTDDVYTTSVKKGKRRIAQVSLGNEDNLGARRIWKADCDSAALASEVRMTCTLPVDLEVIILGCSAFHCFRLIVKLALMRFLSQATGDYAAHPSWSYLVPARLDAHKPPAYLCKEKL